MGQVVFSRTLEELPGDGNLPSRRFADQQPEGFIISGRLSDFINIAGRKVNPAEIEDVIRQIRRR